MNKALLFFLGITLLIALAACGGGAPTAAPAAQGGTTPAPGGDVPPRPVIELQVEGRAHEGLPGASCWLQAPNDVRCEPDPLNLTPPIAVPVDAGQTVVFHVQSESGPPAELNATLLDDEDADGDPIVLEWGTTDTADYTVDLAAGQHRFSVVAEFPAVGGDNSFVTAIFALDVASGVAAGVTPRPTATEVPPTVETEEPAETEATEEALLVPTPTLIVSAVTEVATQALPLPGPTDTAAPPPTEPPMTPMTLPPTASPPPITEMQPTLALAATDVPPSGGEAFPPEMLVVNGGRQFLPSGTTYCYRAGDGREVCVDQPAAPESERILVNNGATIRIDAPEGVPLTMIISLFDTSLTDQLQRMEMIGSAVSLHTITAGAGNYTLAVETTWPQGTVTYYFRVQVLG